MAPMDRYLATVGRYLPEDTREDILREPRDHLLSLLEDREAALGRPLSESEQIDLLQAHGQPLHVAALPAALAVRG